jgi:hypothetical protein
MSFSKGSAMKGSNSGAVYRKKSRAQRMSTKACGEELDWRECAIPDYQYDRQDSEGGAVGQVGELVGSK